MARQVSLRQECAFFLIFRSAAAMCAALSRVTHLRVSSQVYVSLKIDAFSASALRGSFRTAECKSASEFCFFVIDDCTY